MAKTEILGGLLELRRGEDTRTKWQRASGGVYLSDMKKAFEEANPGVEYTEDIHAELLRRVSGMIDEHNSAVDAPDEYSKDGLFLRKLPKKTALSDQIGMNKVELFDDVKTASGMSMRRALDAGPKEPSQVDVFKSYVSDLIEGVTAGHVAIPGAEIDNPTRAQQIFGNAAKFGGAVAGIKRIGGGVQGVTGLNSTGAGPLSLGIYEAAQQEHGRDLGAIARSLVEGTALGVGIGTGQEGLKLLASKASGKLPEAISRAASAIPQEQRALMSREAVDFVTGASLSAAQRGRVDPLEDAAAGAAFALGALPGNVVGAGRARSARAGGMGIDQAVGEAAAVSRLMKMAAMPMDGVLRGTSAVDRAASGLIGGVGNRLSAAARNNDKLSPVINKLGAARRKTLDIIKLRPTIEDVVDKPMERLYKEGLVGKNNVVNNEMLNVRDNLSGEAAPSVNEIRSSIKGIGGGKPSAEEAAFIQRIVINNGAGDGTKGAQNLRDLLVKYPDAPKKSVEYVNRAIEVLDNYAAHPETRLFAKSVEANQQSRFYDSIANDLLRERYIERGAGDNGRFYTQGDPMIPVSGAEGWKVKLMRSSPHKDWRVEVRHPSGTDPVMGGKTYWVVTGKTGALKDGMIYFSEPDFIEPGVDYKTYSDGGTLRSKKSFQHEREVDGGIAERILMGQIPRKYSVWDNMASHFEQTERAKIIKQYISDLRSSTMIDRATGKVVPAAILDGGFQNAVKAGAVRPEMESWYQPIKKSGFKVFDKSTFEETDLMVHRDLLNPLSRFSEAPLYRTGFPKFLNTLNKTLKMAKLTLSPFHYWALAMNTLAYGADPVEAWRNVDSLVRQKKVRDYMRLSPFTLGGGSSDVARASKGYDSILGDASPFRSKVMNKLAGAEQFVSRKLWHEFYRATKIAAMDAAVESHVRSGMTYEDAVRAAGRSINALHGGVNWNWDGMSNRTPQVYGMFMLAPDWFMSNWSWTMNMAFGTGKSSPVDRAAFAKYMTMTYVSMNIMNKLTSGHWMYENEEGHRMSLEIPTPDGGTYWIDPMGGKHPVEWIKAGLGLWNELTDSQIAEGYKSFSGYLAGKRSAVSTLVFDSVLGATRGQTMYPGNRPPASIQDILDGYTSGEWGEGRTQLQDFPAWARHYVNMFIPISAEEIQKSVIEADRTSPEAWISDVLSDPRTLTGLLGTNVKSDR